MKSYGIVSQLTPPYTPQHNGVSERRNQTLLDMVQSMMNLTTLPKSFWGYALETVAHILNMVPTKKVDMTPYEIWHGKAPNLSYLRVWGCEALVKRDTPDKLDSRSIKCIFVGYPKETMGYYFYYQLKKKIVVSQNAEFFKNSFMVQDVSGSHRLLEMSRSDKGLELREVAYIIGIKIIRDRSKLLISFSQSAYLEKTLKKLRMGNSKKGYTLIMENPGYIKSQGAKIPTKSTKQSTTAMSSIEAEYIVVAEASIEAVWTRKFINGGDVMPSNKRPMEMLYDNEPALAITDDPKILKEPDIFKGNITTLIN
uniref:Retrovirus-related Pol polyprotein from transposon TNT 1-94 n=1 Tax=Tanacetum cinerariifolium TaxID=118510 RepID=A0A6L2JV08_TANCI|nr:retrovirus-related Pol polyprotein from transposon TNT 1-94 [Tanacetum cinerariifolium]